MPVVLVLGYGLALADVFTEAALRSGFDVAIVARDGAKLQRTHDSYAEKGKKVIGFPFDLSDSVGVIGLVNQVWETMGGIDVCLYNPTVSVAYTSTPEEFSTAANINITSVHTSFSALLPLWRARGTGGTFMLSGGALGDDGSKGAAYGLQFGAAAKAYFRNFAESTHATFVSEGIYTVCWKVSSLIFGGSTIPDAWNANPDEATAFRAKLLATFSAALSGATKATWQPVVTVTADPPEGKIVIIGATGNAGSALISEFTSRGKSVTALVRDPSKVLSSELVKVERADVSTDDLTPILAGASVVISVINAAPGEGAAYEAACQNWLVFQRKIIQTSKKANVGRLIFMGGAGSLDIGGGVTLFASGLLPAAYLPIAAVHLTLLEEIRQVTDVTWTVLTPPGLIQQGTRTGSIKLGDNNVAGGSGSISYQDFAVALVDEVEKKEYLNKRFCVSN